MTSKIIPFKKTEKSLKKKKLAAKLKDFPDDFLTIGELIKLSIIEGEFKPNDKHVIKFIELIPTTEISKIDTFLFSIAKIINSIDWRSEIRVGQPKSKRAEKWLKTMDNLTREMNERDDKIKKEKTKFYPLLN